MTRGHFHLRRETAEVYIPLRGLGVLVLQDEGGRCQVEDLHPGAVVYVPPGWAHRSVNTGPEPLVFLYVYPADAGHDYETVARTGFRVRVFAADAGPQVVPVGRSIGHGSTAQRATFASRPPGSPHAAGARPGGPRGGYLPPSMPSGPLPPGCDRLGAG